MLASDLEFICRPVKSRYALGQIGIVARCIHCCFCAISSGTRPRLVADAASTQVSFAPRDIVESLGPAETQSHHQIQTCPLHRRYCDEVIVRLL
jgi:hypothetical protein